MAFGLSLKTLLKNNAVQEGLRVEKVLKHISHEELVLFGIIRELDTMAATTNMPPGDKTRFEKLVHLAEAIVKGENNELRKEEEELKAFFSRMIATLSKIY